MSRIGEDENGTWSAERYYHDAGLIAWGLLIGALLIILIVWLA